MMRRALVAALLILAPGVAHAQVRAPSGELAVTLVVARACEVNWPNNGGAELDFGTMSQINTALDADVTVPIQVLCNPDTRFSVTLGFGRNGTDINSRKMNGTISATELVPYQLYKDDGRATVFETADFTGTGDFQDIPIYGRVAAMATLPPVDTYTDTVTVTITMEE